MKKLIVLIGLVALTGCKKKNCDCGEVMYKDIDHYLNSSGMVLSTFYQIEYKDPCTSEYRWINISEEIYNSLYQGDIYCAP
jgi:hypothetical protein